MKRFAATGLARDKEYDLTAGKPNSRVIYFTANPNGEAEVIRVALEPALHLKKLEVLKDLSELAVKGRSSRGNLLTKFKVKSITLKQKGASTLGGRKVWFDPDVLRINYDGMGTYLGEFQSEDRILVIYRNGDYYTTSFELTAHFEDNICRIEKYNAEKTWSLALWDADQNYYYAKRFQLNAQAKPQNFLGENPESRMILLSDRDEATFLVHFTDENRENLTVVMSEFIAVKGSAAKGKRITTYPVNQIEDITPAPPEIEIEEVASGKDNDEVEDESQADTVETTPDKDGKKENNRNADVVTQENNEKPSPAEPDNSTDIPMTINASVPEDSLPAEPHDDQLSLF